jgi:hypothetical protein
MSNAGNLGGPVKEQRRKNAKGFNSEGVYYRYAMGMVVEPTNSWWC